MPTEQREIIFSKSEVWAAIIDYCLRYEVELPNADIEDMETTQGERGELSLDITYKAPAKGKLVTISHAQIGAALINYSRLIRLRLPRGGVKSLSKMGEMVSLCIRIDRTAKKRA